MVENGSILLAIDTYISVLSNLIKFPDKHWAEDGEIDAYSD